jgi:ribosomal protein S18 acetylase RimI-like enzyme
MSVNIRVAGEQDVGAVAHLLQQLFEQESDFVPNLETQKRGLRQIIESPAVGQIFVIEQAHQIVGTVSLLFTISTALGGKVALLEDFIIDRDSRGRGLGSKLLDEALRQARACGCLRVTLLTDGDNLKAQAIYRRAGFVGSSMQPMRRLLA